MIGVGCALSSYGEGHFHLMGVAYRSLGIVSEATRLVLTQHLLKNHKLSVFESQYYLAPIGAAFLLVGAALSETARARRLDALGTMAAHPMLFTAVRAHARARLTALALRLALAHRGLPPPPPAPFSISAWRAFPRPVLHLHPSRAAARLRCRRR